MTAARLRLLQGFALERAGRPVDVPTGTQRLLAFLALRGPVHRCVVAGALWPEVPEGHALSSLRTSIWRMNRVAPGVVHVCGLQLGITATTSIDYRDQEDVASGLLRDRFDEVRRARDGIDCLRCGELLPGWYDDWVVIERERLNQLRIRALERAATVLTRTGELDAAFQVAFEAVHMAPLRETANAALMSVYLAEGNVAEAIRQYESFRDLLRRELEVDPSPRLAGLLPRHGRLAPS